MATHSWEYGWQWRAACRGADSGLFFPPGEWESREDRLRRERKAKSICAVCPVRIECLDYAIRIREPHGIWGGPNELERRLLLREQVHRTLRAVLGSLDPVRRIVKVSVFVASDPGFTDQPQVANGASDLSVELFGDPGRHARVAVGVAELPLGGPVEVELLAEVAT